MGEVIPLAEHRTRHLTAGRPPSRSARPVFYFDLGCPYSYLALERVDRLLPGVRWRPTLAEDLQATDPWADESARATAERRARELGLPLIWPTTNARSPRHAMRAALHAIEHDRIAQFALAAARLAFCGGYDVDHPAVLAEAAAAASLDPDRVLRAAHDERRDEALEETGRRLLAAGASCLPAFGIGRGLHCGETSIGVAAAALRVAGEPGVGAA
jgi:2-hydroxychromene-2-carboxylate isomerase